MSQSSREKLENILTNLTKLEIIFMNDLNTKQDYDAYKTYASFLNSYFIKEHKLANVYWPQHSLPLPKSIREYPTLNDDLLFLTGFDIAFGKQLAFPASFLHSMEYYDILYILSGTVIVKLNEKEFELHSGDMFFLSPNTDCCYNNVADAISVHIMLRTKYIQKNLSMFSKNHLEIARFFNDSLLDNASNLYLLLSTNEDLSIRESLLDAYAEYLWSDYCSPTIIEHYILLLFSYIQRNDAIQIQSNISINSTMGNFAQIEKYILNNYTTATLTQASKTLHFSKQHICRIIKEYSGNTFVELVTDFRLKKAIEYMTETSFSLEIIAELTGFSDAAYLSKVFKKKYQISPSEFRKSH